MHALYMQTPELPDHRGIPAVLVNGPRAAGKTTSARRVAASVVRLDRPAEAAGFLADPDAALRNRPEPLLLDEWQAVPEVLGAVKRSVDDDPRPGRFVLTGSVRADFEHGVWPGTGRLIQTRMYGLTQREIVGGAALVGPSMLDKIARCSAVAFTLPATRPNLRDYIELAVRGGFPSAVLRTPPGSVDVWVNSYLEQLLSRDAHPAAARRDSEKLAAYLYALAALSAGIPEHKTVFDAAGVDAKTARTYDALLEGLYITEQVPGGTPGWEIARNRDQGIGLSEGCRCQAPPMVAGGASSAFRGRCGAAQRAGCDRVGHRHLRRPDLRVLGVTVLAWSSQRPLTTTLL